MREIKFCENNFSFGTEETMKKLKENFEDIDVIVESCLGECDHCESVPYALIDDEHVQADTAEELFEKLKDIIEN